MRARKPSLLQKNFYPLRCQNLHQLTWLSLLRLLGRLMDTFQASASGEPAYWYGERALTGLLAAAAWKMKRGGSLEEFLSLRRHGRKNSSGRGDAWVFVGNHWYTVEAKVKWPRSTSSKAILKAVSDGIGEAKAQLSSLDSAYKRGTTKAAVCYIVPELEVGVGDRPPSANQARESFLKVRDELDASNVVLASYWHQGKLPRHRDRKEGKTFMYPGVIVVVTWWSRVHMM